MKYGTPNCPTCGRELIGEVNVVTVTDRVTRLDDGTFATIGEPVVHWEGERNMNEDEARVLRQAGVAHLKVGNHADTRVLCENDHEWNTTREDA